MNLGYIFIYILANAIHTGSSVSAWLAFALIDVRGTHVVIVTQWTVAFKAIDKVITCATILTWV